MSSPSVHARYPGSFDTTMARLVLPEALGMAPPKYVIRPSGSSTPRMNMCSAIQPSRRAWDDPHAPVLHAVLEVAGGLGLRLGGRHPVVGRPRIIRLA